MGIGDVEPGTLSLLCVPEDSNSSEKVGDPQAKSSEVKEQAHGSQRESSSPEEDQGLQGGRLPWGSKQGHWRFGSTASLLVNNDVTRCLEPCRGLKACVSCPISLTSPIWKYFVPGCLCPSPSEIRSVPSCRHTWCYCCRDPGIPPRLPVLSLLKGPCLQEISLQPRPRSGLASSCSSPLGHRFCNVFMFVLITAIPPGCLAHNRDLSQDSSWHE